MIEHISYNGLDDAFEINTNSVIFPTLAYTTGVQRIPYIPMSASFDDIKVLQKHPTVKTSTSGSVRWEILAKANVSLTINISVIEIVGTTYLSNDVDLSVYNTTSVFSERINVSTNNDADGLIHIHIEYTPQYNHAEFGLMITVPATFADFDIYQLKSEKNFSSALSQSTMILMYSLFGLIFNMQETALQIAKVPRTTPLPRA